MLRLLLSVVRCDWRVIPEVCIGEDGMAGSVACWERYRALLVVMVVVVRAARREGRYMRGKAKTRPVGKKIPPALASIHALFYFEGQPGTLLKSYCKRVVVFLSLFIIKL